MKNKLSVGGLVFSLIYLSLVFDVLAVEKPIVAFKKAMVGDSVSDASRKHLDLDKLRVEMEAAFIATRKFDVVTRNETSMNTIGGEQEFADSDYAEGNAAESGGFKNPDYMIIPEIFSFVFYSKTNKVPNLQNKYFRRDHGTLEMSAQVIDTTTGQIKTTFSMKDSFSTPERVVEGKWGVPNKKHFSDLAKGVSVQMVDQFIDLVFPVKIIKVKENSVYLNRGKDGSFKEGDVLAVYLGTEQLIDPDTGENLGSDEEFVGKIKISRVNPKFTVAAILQESLEGEMSVGCIVRKP